MNMAEDWLMLEHFQDKTALQLRFRHYSWEKPAVTFGYSQSREWIKAQLPGDVLDLSRRPTGGGLVDHRNDWTYSLVVPAHHWVANLTPSKLYSEVHRQLVGALAEQDISSVLSPCGCGKKSKPVNICFEEPSPMDVLLKNTGKKIAGAALKRTKSGTLLQGSIDKISLGAVCWKRFEEDFIKALAQLFQEDCEYEQWPDLDETLAMEIYHKIEGATWQKRR